MLLVGLWLFGTGEALLVDSSLGVSPWTVLAQGIDGQLGIGIGVATFLISAGVLLLWIPLRERPGLGTVMFAVLIGPAVGYGLALAGTVGGVGSSLPTDDAPAAEA